MGKAVSFDAEIARIYDETRLIDPEACRACLRDALSGIVGGNNLKILDAGCGTGRILECLIPCLRQREQVIGIDISPAMLELARSKPALCGVEFHNVSVVDFATVPGNRKYFDVVICHWIFHCVPDWRKAFRSCVSLVNPDGVLVWLEEDGDLYRALDEMSTSNETLKRLFDAYYESVNKELRTLGLGEIIPYIRTGTALRCTDDLANELAAQGWNVQSHFKAHYWAKQVTVGWIISNVFDQRAFTNLRRIPVVANVRAIGELKQKLGKGGLPKEGDILELKFLAKAVVASLSRKKALPVNRLCNDPSRIITGLTYD